MSNDPSDSYLNPDDRWRVHGAVLLANEHLVMLLFKQWVTNLMAELNAIESHCERKGDLENRDLVHRVYLGLDEVFYKNFNAMESAIQAVKDALQEIGLRAFMKEYADRIPAKAIPENQMTGFEPARFVFAPCAENRHDECVVQTSDYYRNNVLCICSCKCHDREAIIDTTDSNNPD